MKKLCLSCKKKIIGNTGEGTFNYKGLLVTVDVGTNCFSCAEKIWIEEFKEHFPGRLIDFKTRKINWEAFALILKESQTEAKKIIDILLSIGIFSFDVRNNWEINSGVMGGLMLNPKSQSCLEVYFTKEEDAIEFAYLVYGSTVYPWTIRHIDRIISKEEVSRRFE